MRWALFGAALLAAIASVMSLARREPPARRYVVLDFPVADPAQRLFGHLFYTEEQSAAITEAGFAIQKGIAPSTTLSLDSLGQLHEVHAILREVECAAADLECWQSRIEVYDCMEDAGKIIGLRLRKIQEIPWPLFTAAMGVSVVTREIHYRTPAALVHFCQKFHEAREKFRRQRLSDATPRP